MTFEEWIRACEVSEDVPDDEVWFVKLDGKIVLRITNIGKGEQ